MSAVTGSETGSQIPDRDTASASLARAGVATASRTRRLRFIPVFVLAAVVGGASGTGGALLVRSDDQVISPRSITQSPPDVPALLSRVLPAVVSVQTTLTSGGRGTGTGMIVSADGEVLTNAHVVAGAMSVSVDRYGTSRELRAHVLGVSASDDLALIKIDDATALPVVAMGDSSRLAVGEKVLAVGNALGLSAGTPTVTEGIVSAQGRSITTVQSGQQVTLEGMLQTDAAINPGNSGGPLFDATGKVVGINTAIAGSAEGIGFAIPVNHAKELLGTLRSGDTNVATQSFLGVMGVGVDAAIRAAHGLTSTTGVLVTDVTPSSPAANAGLLPGDVIIQVEGTTVTDTADLARVVHGYKRGDSIHLLIVRVGITITLQAVLADAPNTAS